MHRDLAATTDDNCFGELCECFEELTRRAQFEAFAEFTATTYNASYNVTSRHTGIYKESSK